MSAPMVAQKAAGGTLIITGTYAASAAVGSRINCNIQWDPSIASQTYIIIPDSEYWLLTDVWAATSDDVNPSNPILEFYKDQDRVLDRSRPMAAVVITSAQRPPGLNSNLGYQGGSHMTVKAVNTVTADSTAEAIKVFCVYEKHS